MNAPDRMHALETALEAVLRDALAAERELSAVSARLHHAREAASGLQGLVGPERAREIAEAVGINLPGRRLLQTGPSSEAARRAALARRAASLTDRDREEMLSAAEQPAVRRGGAVVAPRVIEDRERELALRQAALEERRVVDLVAMSANEEHAASDQLGDDASSTDRVIQLLQEYEGKAIPRAMILEQFEKRGWVDPNWSHPGPAIRMAIRRAVEKGAAKQVGDGRYLYNDPGLLGDISAGGDNTSDE